MAWWDDALDFVKDNALVAVPGVGGLLAGGMTAKDAIKKSGVAKPVVAKVTGNKYSGDGPDPTKNLDTIIRDELQKIAPGQPIEDRMVEYVKNQLGADPAKISAKDFRAAVDKWIQTNPQASQWAGQANPFASKTTPGQLTQPVLQALNAWTQAYQKPFLDQMQATSAAVSSGLKNLLPSLPKSYQDLVKTEIPVYENIGKQLAANIQAADPAMIANAYGQYYSAPTTGTTNTQNPITSILQGAQATGQLPKA